MCKRSRAQVANVVHRQAEDTERGVRHERVGERLHARIAYAIPEQYERAQLDVRPDCVCERAHPAVANAVVGQMQLEQRVVRREVRRERGDATVTNAVSAEREQPQRHARAQHGSKGEHVGVGERTVELGDCERTHRTVPREHRAQRAHHVGRGPDAQRVGHHHIGVESMERHAARVKHSADVLEEAEVGGGGAVAHAARVHAERACRERTRAREQKHVRVSVGRVREWPPARLHVVAAENEVGEQHG
mmetsp:Transcript_25166/g.65027  ORF Transcript_25166/g.65027 Transcript_25166/m.65027 type:complete len:248 (-) Transcript_25166:108-851(-)